MAWGLAAMARCLATMAWGLAAVRATAQCWQFALVLLARVLLWSHEFGYHQTLSKPRRLDDRLVRSEVGTPDKLGAIVCGIWKGK
jgi:hypothetical protein